MLNEFEQINDSAHLLIGLARIAVETYIKDRRIAEPPIELIPEMQRRAGVFVCLKKFGELRGCIGTIEPIKQNVAEEIIQNAISSATRDPRFRPVSGDELAYLKYSIDVLGPQEPVVSLAELDPKRYGVIVQSGPLRGLLLPDLEGIDNAEDQVAVAARKAGISRGQTPQLFRFEVFRYEDNVL